MGHRYSRRTLVGLLVAPGAVRRSRDPVDPPALEGRPRSLRAHSEALLSLDWHGGSRRLATAGLDGEIHVYDPGDLRLLAKAVSDPESKKAPLSVRWNREGTRLASGGADGKIRVWSAEKLQPIRTFGQGQFAYSVDWTEDGRYLAAADLADGRVNVWDPGTGREVWSVRREKPCQVAWRPGSHDLAVTDIYGQVAVFQPSDSRWSLGFTINRFPPPVPPGAARPRDYVTHTVYEAWHPVGKQLAVFQTQAPDGLNVQVLEVPGKQVQRTYAVPDLVRRLAWSADGSRLAAAVGPRGVVWFVHEEGRIWTSEPRPEPVRALAWGLDGTLALGDEGGFLSLVRPGS